MEQNFGEWQGQFREEVRNHRLWIAAPYTQAPGGESFVEVYARCRAAIERWTADCKGRDIVAVAHGGTIRSALASRSICRRKSRWLFPARTCR